MPISGDDRILTWKDFKKLDQRPHGKEVDAEIFTNYSWPYVKFRRSANAIMVDKVEIKVKMDSQQSWVLRTRMTTELLRHEQRHYDICVITANEFYRKIMTFKAPNTEGLDKLIQDENAVFERKMEDVNKRYDKQTGNSQIKTAQAQWDKAIAAEKAKTDGSLDNLP